MQLLKPLPIDKQSKKVFCLYFGSAMLLLALEVWWGISAPSVFARDTGSITAFGFLVISGGQVLFMGLASQHIEAVESNDPEDRTK